VGDFGGEGRKLRTEPLISCPPEWEPWEGEVVRDFLHGAGAASWSKENSDTRESDAHGFPRPAIQLKPILVEDCPMIEM
jgi:hypothetical protein